MSIFDRLNERVTDFIDEVRLPEEIRNLYQKADQAIRRGDYQRALQHLDDVEDRRPGEGRTLHLRALCHLYDGHIDRALELFRQELLVKETPSTYFYLGLCLEKKGQPQEAILSLLRSLQLDLEPPYAFDLHSALARLYLLIDRPDKAAREANKALKLWPAHQETSRILAEALFRRGRLKDARKTLQSISPDKADRDFHLTLGNLESALDNQGAAAAAFEAILSEEPDDLEALLGAARSFLALNQPSKANTHLIRALGGAPDKKTEAQIYTLIGATNEAVQNPEKARESYDAALSRDPQNLEARQGAARQALLQDEAAQAAEHFAFILRAGAPQYHGEALLGLGRSHLAMGDATTARHLLNEARQFYPTQNPQLLLAMGAVAILQDDPAEALISLQDALHADPPRELQAEIEDKIAQALASLRPDWTLPDEFHSTAELTLTLQNLRDLLSKEPRLKDFLPKVHDLLTTLDNPLSVAILGEFNAGKSTLVNAILGESVVPMGVLPTTAHPCIMGYGPRKAAQILYVDGHLQDVDFATARTLMRQEAHQISRLEYSYPHPELRSINYWDTPGFNALDERHEELASQALTKAEAIIWLVDANQALTQTEFDRLEEIPDSKQRVLMVLNKIDRFGDPQQRKDDVNEIVEYLKDNAGDHVLDVLAISALEALNARTDQDQDTSAGDDFHSLLRFLDENFVQRSWEIKISDVSRSLQSLLGQIRQRRQDHIAHLQPLVADAADLQLMVQGLYEASKERPQQLASSMEDHLDFAIVGVEREIAQSLRHPGRFSRRLILEPEDRRFILELLTERLDSVLERHHQELLQELSELEAKLTARLSPLLASLSVTDARPLRRRLEGFFDETRALKLVLHERLFGQWRAQAQGQISTGGEAALDEITALGADASPQDRRQIFAALIPDTGPAFQHDLAQWQEEFFLAASRFCDRLHRDLATLELEVRHRLDFPS